MPEQTTIALSGLRGATPPSATEQEFGAVQRWASEWLSRCHPDLGRAGAVCPFTGTSIKKDLFRLGFVRGDRFDHAGLVELVTDHAATFRSLPPTDGPDVVYKAIVLVFPEVEDFALIDAVHLQCKNAFVSAGLMVGQFYPGHGQGGLRNPDFRPLHAPFAMLAIRHMVVTDYPFLCDDEQWMAAYRARFAATTGCPARMPAPRVRS